MPHSRALLAVRSGDGCLRLEDLPIGLRRGEVVRPCLDDLRGPLGPALDHELEVEQELSNKDQPRESVWKGPLPSRYDSGTCALAASRWAVPSRTAASMASRSALLACSAAHVGSAFYAFGLVLLPPLTFVGLITFARAVQSGVEDYGYAVRIARLRAFYLTVPRRSAPTWPAAHRAQHWPSRGCGAGDGRSSRPSPACSA